MTDPSHEQIETDDPAFNCLPIVAYPTANDMGLGLVGALKDLCVLKGYVSMNNGLLKNEDDVLAEGVAEALCTLAEAFNH